MKTPTTVGGFEIRSFDVTKTAQEIYNLWEKADKKGFSFLWKVFNEPHVVKGVNAKVYFYQDGLLVTCPDAIGEHYDYLEDVYLKAEHMLREVIIERNLADTVSVERKGSMVGLFGLRNGKPKEPLVSFRWSGGNINIRTFSVSMIELEVILDFVQRVFVYDVD